MIMFSCISRRLSFGILMSEEIKQVQQVWNAPWLAFSATANLEDQEPGNTSFIITLVVFWY